MKVIWVFGKSQPLRNFDGIYAEGECDVRYMPHAQYQANPSRLEGARPHLIINISKPPKALAEYQPFMAMIYDAKIINLY